MSQTASGVAQSAAHIVEGIAQGIAEFAHSSSEINNIKKENTIQRQVFTLFNGRDKVKLDISECGYKMSSPTMNNIIARNLEKMNIPYFTCPSVSNPSENLLVFPLKHRTLVNSIANKEKMRTIHDVSDLFNDNETHKYAKFTNISEAELQLLKEQVNKSFKIALDPEHKTEPYTIITRDDSANLAKEKIMEVKTLLQLDPAHGKRACYRTQIKNKAFDLSRKNQEFYVVSPEMKKTQQFLHYNPEKSTFELYRYDKNKTPQLEESIKKDNKYYGVAVKRMLNSTSTPIIMSPEEFQSKDNNILKDKIKEFSHLQQDEKIKERRLLEILNQKIANETPEDYASNLVFPFNTEESFSTFVADHLESTSIEDDEKENLMNAYRKEKENIYHAIKSSYESIHIEYEKNIYTSLDQQIDDADKKVQHNQLTNKEQDVERDV